MDMVANIFIMSCMLALYFQMAVTRWRSRRWWFSSPAARGWSPPTFTGPTMCSSCVAAWVLLYTSKVADNTVCSHRPLQLRNHRQLLSVGGAAGEDQPAQVSVCLDREGSHVHGLLRSQRQHRGVFGGTLDQDWWRLSQRDSDTSQRSRIQLLPFTLKQSEGLIEVWETLITGHTPVFFFPLRSLV